IPNENLSAGAGEYAFAVMAHMFLSDRWRPAGARGSASAVTARRSFLMNDGPRLAWARTRLWSGVGACGEPVVPAGGGVPERGEALPDAGLVRALVALGGPAWPGGRVRGAGQRPRGLAGRAEGHVLLRLRHVHRATEDPG